MTQCGITFGLRTSRLVSSDAPMFEPCQQGDLAQVRLLFQNGYASPLDYCYDEWKSVTSTPLAAAAASRNAQLFKYLLDAEDEELVPSQTRDVLRQYLIHGNNHLRYYVLHDNPLSYNMCSRRKTNDVEMYRLLLEHSKPDFDNEVANAPYWFHWWLDACPDIGCIKMLRHKIHSEHGPGVQQHLVDFAFSGSAGLHPLDVFLAMLGYEGIVDKITTLQDSHGRTALYLAARQIPACDGYLDLAIGASWLDFVSKLVILGADVHKQNDSTWTPLLALFVSSGQCDVVFNNVLQRWVQALESAGVDLTKYGETEIVLWDEMQTRRPMDFQDSIVSWTSGPNVCHWTTELEKLHVLVIYRLDTPPGSMANV